MKSTMRIYFDCCCFNRPYDDLTDEMVRMEAEAIISIIAKCENGGWEYCGSDVLQDEIDNATNLVKKQKVLLLFRAASSHIDLTPQIVFRAKEFERMGVKPYDSLHLACAEAGNADVFLTTDRKLINTAKATDIKVKVANPLPWLTEVLYDEF